MTAGKETEAETVVNKQRVFIACFLLVTASALVYTYYAYVTPQNWDELFHVKSSLVSPSDISTPESFGYAVDHPSIKRHAYGAALHLVGIREMNIPDVDYTRGVEWNMENGRVPPMRASVVLRLVNSAFMTAALVLLYFTTLKVTKAEYLSLLAPAALLFNNRAADQVAAYLGCDAILAFFLALSVFVWMAFAAKGKAKDLWAIAAIGAAAGLAVSAKFNGALVIVAYCAYLAIAGRGMARVGKPLLAGAVCAAVFVALNPVMRIGGIQGAVAAVEAMLQRRHDIWLSQYGDKPLSRVRLVAKYWPYVSFVPAYAAAAVMLKKRKWVSSAMVWGIVLVAGTVLSVNRVYRRYYLPSDMATFTLAAILAWALLAEVRGRTAGARLSGRKSAALAGVITAAVMLTFVAAYEPWGPYREHTEKSVAAKVAVFYRQSAAYYGLGDVMTVGEVKETLSVGDTRQRPTQPPREPIGLGPERAACGAALVAALGVAFLLTKRATGSAAAGAVIAAILLWNEFAQGTYYGQSPSDKYFALWAVGLLALWMGAAGRESAWSWGMVTAGGVLAGLAAASAPAGIALAGAAGYAAWRGGRGAWGAAVTVLAAAAVFAAAEPVLCYLGARDTLAMTRGILSGSARLWTGDFAGNDQFLYPVEYYFGYWPLLPLAAVTLYAARRHKWAGAAALWAGVIVATDVVCRQGGFYRLTAGMNMALTLGAGLGALAVIRFGKENRQAEARQTLSHAENAEKG